MRIETIELSWFRGGGPQVSLETKSKSVVVYGANGSGKSSFADALEYIIANGKIAHLSHEYSGPKQREGIRNTHAPKDAHSTVKILCNDKCSVTGKITPTGRLTIQSEPPDTKELFQSLDLERFILRQDELADFIHATKGKKYSVLLPLLGLDEMEQVAANLQDLKKALEKQSNIEEKRRRLKGHQNDALKYLPDLDPETVLNTLTDLGKKYLECSLPIDEQELLDLIKEAVTERINQAEPEKTRHMLFKQIDDDNLKEKLINLNEANERASELISALIDRQIDVLEAAQSYAQNIQIDTTIIECPACGREVNFKEFASHVQDELSSLTSIRSAKNSLNSARKSLINAISRLNTKEKDPVFKSWLESPEQKDLNAAINRLLQLELDEESRIWDASEWACLQQDIPTISDRFSELSKDIPPSTQELIKTNQIVSACEKVPEVNKLSDEIHKIDQIVTCLDEIEASVRDTIKDKTKITIKDVSNEVQILWSKLHPDEPIEEIQLYIPKDAEKAIDICLKFFGVDQPSPRLSLSEGHRNSLGLCIFLALVKLEKENDRPIVLDDVVSSMDREHRGMLAKIFLEDFDDRQVIVLTHDREWYSELKARLPARQWEFLALKPWQDPETGIQWSNSRDTFDDSRVLIAKNPTAAGNRARAIMDTQMAIVAEKLYIPVCFARGDRNDHRTCIEFLDRTISMAKKSLRKKKGDAWPVYQEPLSTWQEARNLLVSWGNRASHTGTLTDNEAEELIQICEKSLANFRCTECGDPIWIADQTSRKRLQCSCGLLQWRY